MQDIKEITKDEARVALAKALRSLNASDDEKKAVQGMFDYYLDHPEVA